MFSKTVLAIFIFINAVAFAQVQLNFRGQIDQRSTERLMSQITSTLEGIGDDKRKVINIQLDSTGGEIEPARRLVRFIKQLNLDPAISINTVLGTRFRNCESSCTIVFTAGKERIAHPRARFGFHSPRYQSGAPNGMTGAQVEEMYRKIWLSYIEQVDAYAAEILRDSGYLLRDRMRYISASDVYPGYVTTLL
jgi:hypothetical protein